MREQFTTNAINLKSYNFGEADKIVVMYSKEKGIIKGVAKGIKKPKSKLGGRMDLFVANKIILNKGRNLDTVCQADAINTFFHIRSDIDKLFYAMYCGETVSNFGIENDPDSEEIYKLFYDFLDKISKTENKNETMLCVLKFQLKIAEIKGYGIEFGECVKCGKQSEENVYFSIENGGILCESCAKDVYKKLKVPYKIVEFLRTMLNAEFNETTKYDGVVTEKICESCINLLKDYIGYYSPKRFKTLEVTECIK